MNEIDEIQNDAYEQGYNDCLKQAEKDTETLRNELSECKKQRDRAVKDNSVFHTTMDEALSAVHESAINRTSTLIDALKEVLEFLDHIEPKVAPAAFQTIYEVVEEALMEGEVNG